MRYTLLVLMVVAHQAVAQPARVVVEPAELVLEVEAVRALKATAYDADGQALRGAVIRWYSPDEAVLGIDGDGVARAYAPGRVRIAATAAGVPGYATVAVRQLPPAEIIAELPVEGILAGTSAPLNTVVRTRAGVLLPDAEVDYESSDARIATINPEGRIFGHQPGTTTIRAMAGGAWTHRDVRVVPNPAATYEVVQSLAPVRTGDVVRFDVIAKTNEGRDVNGVYPAWTVGPSGAQIDTDGATGVFVAEEPGSYTITARVGRDLTRTVAVEVAPRRYDARLVQVGRGPIGHHHSGDTWAFEGVDGRDYAYIGTFMHDWMKAWDVTDPAHPVLTDSLRLDARRINDVKIHPDNRLAVVTREGASSRRNGIVLLDLGDPAHPVVLSEYTRTVTGGVHNVWIRGDEDLVYAVHNGTSDLHIIDIADPTAPEEVGRWGLDTAHKTLHDVIVQDGYAYLSYWDDGLVILDVGAGTHGGTPTSPALVSQYKYPIGNTHVAWRHGRYVYVGDEIYPPDWDPNAAAPIEARGYIHVVDVEDIDHPVEVARYEVPEAGAHNVWAEGDRLYVGYYQGGLRVLDVSGELRGDLYRQGREVAAFKTTDAVTMVPNWPMTWSAQLFKGLLYSADMNSGLWITRLVEDGPAP